MSARAACCACLALGGLVLSAQEPTPPDVGAFARRVRSATIPDAERAAAADALLAAGDRAALALLEALTLEDARAAKDFRAETARVRQGFARHARALLVKRMGRTGAGRADVLRREVLQRSRSADLTRTVITAEIDPRLAELRQLLAIDAATVLAAAPAVAAQRERALAHAELMVKLWQVRGRADDVLAQTAAGRELARRHPAPADPRALAAQLDTELERLAERATPMGERDARTLQANEAVTDGVDAEEKAGILALNRTRALLGLPVLAIDIRLCAAARDHARDMAELDFFGHDSPVSGKATFTERAARAGTSAAAENIAHGQATGAEAIRVWWYSPGHHRNMLADAVRVGLGRHATHWTQLLGN